MNSKRCIKCGLVKPISEYYKHPQMGDGYLNKCKSCCKENAHRNYRKNRKRRAEYERKRFQDPIRKEKAMEYQRKRRKRQRQKYLCRQNTIRLVRQGKLEKLSCHICGDENTEAHHLDYSNPYAVIWLCRKHHLMVHGKKAYIFESETVNA